MKFLVDNALSPVISELLTVTGYDAKHVRDVGLQNSSDVEIFDFALLENRIIISADTDFGFLLAFRNNNKPSVILFRKGVERDPYQQIEILNLNLNDKIKGALNQGSIIIFEREKIRIKSLPIHE